MSESKAKPYAAIINITVEVHPVLETGEMSGTPVAKKDLMAKGVSNRKSIKIEGFDLTDCLKQLNEFYSRVNP